MFLIDNKLKRLVLTLLFGVVWYAGWWSIGIPLWESKMLILLSVIGWVVVSSLCGFFGGLFVANVNNFVNVAKTFFTSMTKKDI